MGTRLGDWIRQNPPRALAGFSGCIAMAVGLVLMARIAGKVGSEEMTDRLADSVYKRVMSELEITPDPMWAEVKELQDDIVALKREVVAAGKPAPEGEMPRRVEHLESQVQKLEASVNDVSSVIQQTSGKSLALVIVNKELDTIRSRIDISDKRSTDDLGRVYDLSKWVIGLMFSLILGVLGLALSQYFKAEKAKAS